ncbi:MAG: glycosyltransferase family 2 protein [Prevotella sp.]|nr:glycosyltransferase family 2 protein [Prevotella sp.]
MITVLTPSYNRGDLLKNLYQSLRDQIFDDFEWIVVDDGSTDSTSEIITHFKEDKTIVIKYIKQSNGGKHTAINAGVKISTGELIIIVDSDDTLPKDSLLIINNQYLKIREDATVGGVCGLMAHHDNIVIGNCNLLPQGNISSIDMRFKYGFLGDVCEVFKTDVLREFPFPEIYNEKFCPEDLVWNRIARKYTLYFFNQVVYYRDYLDGGLTSKIVKIRMKSPIASTICYGEMLDLDIPIKSKIKAAINYWRFYLCIKNKSKAEKKIAPLWICLLPAGLIFHIKDRLVTK